MEYKVIDLDEYAKIAEEHARKTDEWDGWIQPEDDNGGAFMLGWLLITVPSFWIGMGLGVLLTWWL